MSLVIQSINRSFSPANIYPSSFWLLCFIPTFITKTPTIHYQNTHYSLLEQDTSPYLSLAINYHLKIMRFFLSHLTLLFSIQYAFRERRIIIHLKYFLQISNRLSSQSTGIGKGIGILPINISRHGNMAEKR